MRPCPLTDLEPLDVIVTVDAPQELNHSSFVLAGLFDLLDRRLLRRVRIDATRAFHRGEVHVGPGGLVVQPGYRSKKTTFFTIRSEGRLVRAAIDFRDSAWIFPADALEGCDVLFKRSYEPPAIDLVRPHARCRIEPAGLSFGAASPHGRGNVAAWLGYWMASARDGIRPDRDLLRRARRHFREDLEHWRATRGQPLSDHLRSLTGAVEANCGSQTVFFQTRSFDRIDDEDANEVHEQRATLIRLLRSEFGPSFVGGFIADDLVRDRYPDCLSTVNPDKSSYYGAMASAGVAIYTRGLVDSAAWKLPEYLAHGKCILGEPVRAVLPQPLVDQVDWEIFETPEECVERCHRLLLDDAARVRLGSSARAYYERWVDPMVAMHRIVTTALNGAGPREEK